MDESMYRKKALQIESMLLMFGQSKLSKIIGIDEAQICRMKVAKGREKNSFFKTMSIMLAVLEYGIEDDEMAELTRRLASFLTKEKAPMSGNSFEA